MLGTIVLLVAVLIIVVAGAVLACIIAYERGQASVLCDLERAQIECRKLRSNWDGACYQLQSLQQQHAALLAEPAVAERQRQAEIVQRKHQLELAHIDQQLLEAAHKREATERFKDRKFDLGEVRFGKRIADGQLDTAEIAEALDAARPQPAPDAVATLITTAVAYVDMVQQLQADGRDDPRANEAAETARALVQLLNDSSKGAKP